jgi:hypothetical protein
MRTHTFKEKLPVLTHYLFQQINLLINKHGLRDKILILSLVIGVLVGVQGFTWGRYDCLNLDKMAFQSVFDKNRLPFQPARYVKPPFYTYLNHFVARIPAMTVSSLFFWKKSHERYEIFLVVRTWIARTLNLIMFAACTTAIFISIRKNYNLGAARFAALLFATSAGFVPYQIFLTTDLAVIFVMLASFLFALRIINNPSMSNSIAAGLLAGLATATKYNGLAVAIALPLAHLLACRSGNPLIEAIKRKSAWMCGACVPLGFLLGNPYTIFDWQKFRADFLYNYTVTPVYNGATSGNGYSRFFESFYEIFGVPGTFFLAVALVLGLGFVLLNFKTSKAWQLWIMAGAVFALYTYKIGAFPRIETRFVLPAAPFLLIMASAGFTIFLKARFLSISVLAVILAYNLAFCWWTGRLFANDPRNYIPEFAKKKLQNGGIVEWSKSNPKLEALPVKLQIHEIRTGLERAAMFDKMFADNAEIHAMVKKKEVQVTPEWFSVESRKSRNTDYVVWSTIDLEGIVRKHYDALFDESSGYRVFYDAQSPKQPDWVYPKRTEFTRNRTTIWEKIPTS